MPSHDKEIPIDNTLQAEDHEDIVVINDNSEIEPTLDDFFSQTEPMILSPEEQSSNYNAVRRRFDFFSNHLRHRQKNSSCISIPTLRFQRSSLEHLKSVSIYCSNRRRSQTLGKSTNRPSRRLTGHRRSSVQRYFHFYTTQSPTR